VSSQLDLLGIEYCRTVQHSETGAEMVARRSTGVALGEEFFSAFSVSVFFAEGMFSPEA
jgi:hypothetical protein